MFLEGRLHLGSLYWTRCRQSWQTVGGRSETLPSTLRDVQADPCPRVSNEYFVVDMINSFAIVYEEHSHKSIWLIDGLAPRVDHLHQGVRHTHTCQPEMAKMTEIFHQNDWDFSSLPRGLDNLAMGPKQHHLYSKPEYTNSQHMLHFTTIPITTCFILLQYQPQHVSFFWNMLHFTGIKTSFSWDWVEEQPTCAKLCNYIQTKKGKLEAQFKIITNKHIAVCQINVNGDTLWWRISRCELCAAQSYAAALILCLWVNIKITD